MRISPVAVALLAVHGAAWGTSCAYPPPCGLIVAGSILITGKVDATLIDGDPKGKRWFRVEVHDALLGLDPQERYAWVEGEFTKGKEYFLDLRRDEEGELYPQFCGSSDELNSRSRETVQQIKDLQRTGKGTVQVWLRLNGSNMEGMEVSIDGPSGTKQGTTDKDGWAFFKELDPGHYRMRSLEQHYQPESDDTREVEVLAGGCSSAYWHLQGDGVVSGTVKTQTGIPAANLRLQLAEHLTMFNAVTDAQGRFRFENVTPGEYRLGTNLMEVRTASIPHNEVVPGYFEVKPGATVDGIEFTIPDYGPAREIRFHVIDRDSGRPLVGAYIRDTRVWAPELGGLIEDALKTDANGVAIASGWEDVGYRVNAEFYQGPGILDRLVSGSVDVRPGRGPIDVILKLRPLREGLPR